MRARHGGRAEQPHGARAIENGWGRNEGRSRTAQGPRRQECRRTSRLRFSGGVSGRLGLRHRRRGGGHSARLNRVVAAMPVSITLQSFFLDVRHLAVRGQFAIATHHTTARERCKAEEPYEAHGLLLESCHCKLHAPVWPAVVPIRPGVLISISAVCSGSSGKTRGAPDARSRMASGRLDS